MSKTTKAAWTTPQLRKLGTVADVAGNKNVNFNGASGNNKS